MEQVRPSSGDSQGVNELSVVHWGPQHVCLELQILGLFLHLYNKLFAVPTCVRCGSV